jgi:hypothetical protein
MMVGTTSSYTTMVLDSRQPQVVAAAATADKQDNDEDTAVPGPKSLSSIELAMATMLRIFPAIFRTLY